MNRFKCHRCKKVFEFPDGQFFDPPPGCPRSGRGCDLTPAPEAPPPEAAIPSPVAQPPPSSSSAQDALASVGMSDEPAAQEGVPPTLPLPPVVQPVVTVPPEPPPPAAPPASIPQAAAPFSPGYLVGGAYRIAQQLPKTTGDRNDYFIAVTNMTGVRVMVRRCMVRGQRDGEMRAKVKKWMDNCLPSGVVRLLWTHVENDTLVEVTEIPEGETLDAWAKKRTLTRADIDRIALPILGILKVLQYNPANQLLHLNITPRSLYVSESAQGFLTFTLAGLERAVVIDSDTELRLDGFDLRYLPPEAAGVDHMEFTGESSAWDWWSVGRTLQEIILGAHPFEKVPRATASTRPYQKIMLGQDDRFRPGLVELMPQTIDPEVKLLLEGLLTANVTARWGCEAFEKWGTPDAPQAHYALGVRDPIFIFRGEPCTLAQAARNIARQETAAVAIEQALMTSRPATLAATISQIGDPILVDHLKAGAALYSDAPNEENNPIWKSLRQQLAAAVTLGLIAGENDGYLWLAGERLDRNWLFNLVKSRRDRGDVRFMAEAIASGTSPRMVDRIRVAGFKGTADAFQTTCEVFVHLIGVAEKDSSLVDLQSATGVVRALSFATRDPQNLLDTCSKVRMDYPASGNSLIAELLPRDKISLGEAALLAMGIDDERKEPVASFLLIDRVTAQLQAVANLRKQGAQFAGPALNKMAWLPMKWAPWTYGGFWGWLFFSGPATFLLIDWVGGFQGDAVGSESIPVVALYGGAILALKMLARALGWLIAMLWLRKEDSAKGASRVPFFGTRKHLFTMSMFRGDKRPRRSLRELKTEVQKINDEIVRHTPEGQPPQTIEFSTPISLWIIAAVHGLILAGIIGTCLISTPHDSVARRLLFAYGSKLDTAQVDTNESTPLPAASASGSRPQSTWDKNGLFAPTEEEGLKKIEEFIADERRNNAFTFASTPPQVIRKNVAASGEIVIEATFQRSTRADTFTKDDPQNWLLDPSRTEAMADRDRFRADIETLKVKNALPPNPIANQEFYSVTGKAGTTSDWTISWRVRSTAKGWDWERTPAARDSAAVNDSSQKTREACGPKAIFHGTPEYDRARDAYRQYQQEVMTQAQKIRSSDELKRTFGPILPGVCYSGLLRYNGENQGTEVRVVWDSLDRRGESVSGFLYCVDRMWVRKYFVGRAERNGSAVVANVDIREHGGSATFDRGVFSPRYSGSIQITADDNGSFHVKGIRGSDFTVKGERMAKHYGMYALNGPASEVRSSSEVKTTRDQALNGDSDAASRCAKIALKMDDSPSRFESAAWLEWAWSLGDMDSGCEVVMLMLEGKLGWKNYPTGLRLLEKLDEQRCGNATMWLGHVYNNGLYGVTVDSNRSMNHYRRGADRGHTVCMAFYGSNLLARSRNPQEESEAAEWLRKAAEGGSKWGMHRYALCLAKGWGVRRDAEAAARYRELSGFDEKGKLVEPSQPSGK